MTTARDYYARPDGEYFVDEGTKPIPPAETWDNLSVNQLIDVQNQLYEKMFAFRQNPVIQARLSEGLQKVQALIALRNSGV